jgi:EmrB/QacA subfamily drug resistance transporter
MAAPALLPRSVTPSRSHPAWTVLLTSVAFFMTVLDALVVMTALPSIQRDLGGGMGSLQWIVNAYSLTFGAGILTAAALGDRLGRRRVYILGLALFTVASATCAVAPNLPALVAARAVQGLGGAIVAPLSLTLLTAAFPPERRGVVIGIWGAIAGLAAAAGPLVGGAVSQGLSWHWVFWVNVPVGLAAVIGARLRLAESRGPRSRLDLAGLLLISASVVGLTFGLVQSSSNGWGSPAVLLALGAGALLLLGFGAWEARAPAPMIPLPLLRKPAFAAAVSAMFLAMASLVSAAFLGSQYFQFGLGFSPLATGLAFLPWTVIPLFVAPIAGAVSDRIGSRTLMVSGLLLQGMGLTWVALAAGPASSYVSFLGALVVFGLGVALVQPTGPVAAVKAVAPSEIGKASGIFNTMRSFGGVFGVAAATTLFSAHGSLATPAAVASGFRPALLLSAAFSLVGVAVAAKMAGRASDAARAQRSLGQQVSAGSDAPAEPAGLSASPVLVTD